MTSTTDYRSQLKELVKEFDYEPIAAVLGVTVRSVYNYTNGHAANKKVIEKIRETFRKYKSGEDIIQKTTTAEGVALPVTAHQHIDLQRKHIALQDEHIKVLKEQKEDFKEVKSRILNLVDEVQKLALNLGTLSQAVQDLPRPEAQAVRKEVLPWRKKKNKNHTEDNSSNG